MLVPNQAAPVANRSNYPVSKRHSWFAFTTLFVLMVFDKLDGNIVTSKFPFIKEAWGLSDAQLGSIASIVPLMVGIPSVPAA